MNRPARLVTAALTVSAALLLTACGSGGSEDGAADRIKGADRENGEASPSASAPPSPRASGQPEIELPDSFRMEFEGWTHSDPELQAILDGGREQLRADHAAVIEGDPEADYVTYYNREASLQASRKWIKQYVDADVTLVGRLKVSDPQVRINDSGAGVLFYCVDESAAFAENRETGERTGTPAGDSPRLRYRTLLEKSPQGVWRTTRAQTERGAC
ncbi:hypothetical protein ACH4TS_15475 [Streptomyces albidoflavus]